MKIYTVYRLMIFIDVIKHIDSVSLYITQMAVYHECRLPNKMDVTEGYILTKMNVATQL